MEFADYHDLSGVDRAGVDRVLARPALGQPSLVNHCWGNHRIRYRDAESDAVGKTTGSGLSARLRTHLHDYSLGGITKLPRVDPAGRVDGGHACRILLGGAGSGRIGRYPGDASGGSGCGIVPGRSRCGNADRQSVARDARHACIRMAGHDLTAWSPLDGWCYNTLSRRTASPSRPALVCCGVLPDYFDRWHLACSAAEQ
mgnify:CR=1 FL=1